MLCWPHLGKGTQQEDEGKEMQQPTPGLPCHDHLLPVPANECKPHRLPSPQRRNLESHQPKPQWEPEQDRRKHRLSSEPPFQQPNDHFWNAKYPAILLHNGPKFNIFPCQNRKYSAILPHNDSKFNFPCSKCSFHHGRIGGKQQTQEPNDQRNLWRQ